MCMESPVGIARGSVKTRCLHTLKVFCRTQSILDRRAREEDHSVHEHEPHHPLHRGHPGRRADHPAHKLSVATMSARRWCSCASAAPTASTAWARPPPSAAWPTARKARKASRARSTPTSRRCCVGTDADPRRRRDGEGRARPSRATASPSARSRRRCWTRRASASACRCPSCSAARARRAAGGLDAGQRRHRAGHRRGRAHARDPPPPHLQAEDRRCAAWPTTSPTCWRSSAPGRRVQRARRRQPGLGRADAVRGIAALEAGGVDLIEQPVRAPQPARAGAAGAPLRRADHGRRGAARPGRCLGAGRRRRGRRLRREDLASPAACCRRCESAAVAAPAGIGLYGGTHARRRHRQHAAAHVFAAFADAGLGHRTVRPPAADRGDRRASRRSTATSSCRCRPAPASAWRSTSTSSPSTAATALAAPSPTPPEETHHAVPRTNERQPAATMPADEADELKASEKEIAQGLQREGKWRHLWRIAGQLRQRQHLRRRRTTTSCTTLLIDAAAVPLHADRGDAAVPPSLVDPRRRPLIHHPTLHHDDPKETQP